jgi:preprotein translocase SecE subunit
MRFRASRGARKETSMAESNDSPTTPPAAAAEAPRGLSVYKPGQGYYTRMGTVVGVAIVTLLGILWAWEYMQGWKIGSVNPLYVATGGAIVIGGLVTFVMYMLVFVKPRTVDFLIATEGEMKKVNWSTRREVIGSTGAVIVTAIAIAVFCYVIDIGFFAFFRQINVLDS